MCDYWKQEKDCGVPKLVSTVEKNEKKSRLSAEETRERLIVVGLQALPDDEAESG